MPSIEYGVIGSWWGSVLDIPQGWHLCDGTAGTPDLSDKFIVAAGSAYGPGATGGSAAHSHDATADGHSHTIAVNSLLLPGYAYENLSFPGWPTFTSAAANHLPTYYTLCFIQFIGT